MRKSRIAFVALVVFLATVVGAGAALASESIDAVFAVWGASNRICLNDGTGGFTCSDVSSDTYATASVAIGLVDGDQHPDAVFGNRNSQRDRVCFGDGLGGFSSCSDADTAEDGTSGVALGHIDNDQHLDAIFASTSTNSRNRICLGDGTGSFTCSNVEDLVIGALDVALGLIDNDQNLDAVFAVWGTNFPNRPRNRVCLGDGSGGFSCSDVSTDEFHSNGVALGYIDNDQILDAVFANEEQRNRVCIGNGLGGFTCSDVSTDEHFNSRVALGLINGDQNLDAVFGVFFGGQNRVCLGDGAGNFTCSDVSTDAYDTGGVGLGYIDDDQYLDAVFANYQERNRLCLGDGMGGFSCSDLSSDENDTWDVALGDVDSARMSLYCFSFDNFCDGIEVTDVAPDKTVAGTWRNYNCGGETRPMLGGYSGKGVSPRLSWIAGDRNALLDVYSYNLNVDARTFDLFKHDTAFNLIQFQDDEPYTVTPGACAFGPEKEGLASSMEALGSMPIQAPTMSSEASPFGPDVTFPFCIDFDNSVDGIEVSAIQADKMIVATWENYDDGGSVAPMLGGFSKGPPRRAYIMSDIGVLAPGDIFVFTLEVDLGTFDLWNQDAAGNVTQFEDNQPYTITNGTCPF